VECMGDKKFTATLVGKWKRKRPLEDLDIDGRTMLKRFKNEAVRVKTRLQFCETKLSGRFL
jgi:hypothetical protein